MNSTTPHRPGPRRLVRHCMAAGLLALAAAPAWLQAATPAASAAGSKAEATYRADRAACLSGASQQGQVTCLKEAGAVLAERRSGQANGNASAATLQANALKRCGFQPPAERDECERLARGEGTQQGTVAGGGVIKAMVTVVPAAPLPVPAPTSAPASAAR
jgi:hypothetical protein